MENASQTVSVHQAIQIALQHHQAGRLPQAEAIYQKVLQKDPNHPDALHLLGVIAHQVGRNETAVELINKAIHANSGNPFFHNNIGEAYRALNRLDEALACYRKALSLKPDYAEAHNNLGNVFKDQDRFDDAMACFDQALSLKPDFAEAHNNRGTVLKEQGKPDQALACYQKALALKPDFAEAHNNLGVAFKEQDKPDQALACYQKALALKPDYAKAYNNLGNVFKDLGRPDEALACYRKALSLKPDYAEARWALAMTQLPPVYGPDDKPQACRAEFSRELDELNRWFGENRAKDGYKSVGVQQPFFLAYQEQNNRDLLSRYGALCARLMQDWQDRQAFPTAKHIAEETIRVGIVSAHIHDHPVWNAIVKGWFRHLHRGRFELHVFHVGSIWDRETAWARSQSTSFKQEQNGLRQWVESILHNRPDVLIYPEIGMDPMTVKLASLRLAPVQAAAWGHPETTGLPTMDYYLSATDIEPPDAQENYTEKLVPLPGLGCCYQPLPTTAAEPDFAALGIDPESPILLCPGTPFKYAPQHDGVFIEIARRASRCQFIFFTCRLHGLSERLRQRLECVFAQSGLDINDYARFIPWQERSVFYGLMKRADLLLDTIGFSGFNTAMQAMECGLPVVTKQGRFMRGRLAGGILRRMGLPELIAPTEEDYVALVVKLSRDAEYRQSIRRRIEASRPVLFDDVAPVRALEDFLISVVKGN